MPTATPAADTIRDAFSDLPVTGPAPAAPAPAPPSATPAAPRPRAPRPAARVRPVVALPSPGPVARPCGAVYTPRALGPHADVAALRALREAQVPVLQFGPPGAGKTALNEAAFEDLITVNGSGDTEVADFVGTYVPRPDGTNAWVDGPLVRAMREGRALLIDEVALIDPRVMAVVYSAMDGRGELVVTANPDLGVVAAMPGFYVTAGCNPHAPGARMSEALLSRFVVHVEVGTDYELARALGVPAKAVTVAKNLATKVAGGEIEWAPQLRELLGFKRVAEVLGEDVAARNLISIAPEHDRSVVAEIVTRAFGSATTGLSLGGQV